jgi:penicillin-binding protein 2
MAFLSDIQIYGKRRVLTRLFIAVFLLFTGRLVQLQMIYKDEYGKKSDENSLRIIPKEPVRGYVYDRHGVIVVDNRPSFTVTIMPFEFDKKKIDYCADLLSLEPRFILDRLRKGEEYSRFAPVKIKRDISFRELALLEENRDRMPGVDYQVESKRLYPGPARTAHLLGYSKEISESQIRLAGGEYRQGDVVGSVGLEAGFERSLRGVRGAEYSTINVYGQVVGRFDNGRHDIPAVEGKDLLLTLDAGLQAFAESLMVGKRGAVVAIDPADGGVLAMVSTPDYDLSYFSGVTPPSIWQALSTDPAKPLYNRATQTRYPPGSTFKMILAMAALETQTVTPSWRINCGGSLTMGNKVFKDLHVHGSVDMISAIQHSCNVYFYQLILKTGLDSWAHYGREFGFGTLTGIDIAEESPGLLPTTAYFNKRYGKRGWTRGFLPSLGIGQGEVGVTPLQMAAYVMTLGNRGYYHQPHAVRALVDKATKQTDTLVYQTRHLNFAEESWNVIREGMRRAVMLPGGTGGAARIKGIEVAGKTGTAQNPPRKDHAWFIGFAPYDSPRIAIAVLVENAGFGGAIAAPIAGRCMERYLRGSAARLDSVDLKSVEDPIAEGGEGH